MSFRAIGTTAAALALLVSIPANAAAASVRPGSAVPTAASASSVSLAAQGGEARSMTPWPAYLAIALTLAVGVWIAVDGGDSSGDSSISRG